MKRRYRLIPLFLVMLLFSCSGKSAVKTPEAFDPEKAFQTANEFLEDKEYEEARAGFLEVKNRDMTKKFAPLAQLKIADSYEKEEQYDLAVAEYKRFLNTYPDFQYAPYAQYQIAMVSFNQIEDPERGYSGAARALEAFEKLKTMFPRNPYKEVVELRIQQCKNIIAEYEYLVGHFYYKKGSYNAAVGRFEGLLKEYPDYKEEAKVLFYTGIAYKELGQNDKASEYLNRLVEHYPNDSLVRNAQKALAKLNK
jgi:outer membrane protein assembly factor BamD